MLILISTNAVAGNVEKGTVIGTFNIPAVLQSQTDPEGLFAISGMDLVSNWTGTAPEGLYTIIAHADVPDPNLVPFVIFISEPVYEGPTQRQPLLVVADEEEEMIVVEDESPEVQ